MTDAKARALRLCSKYLGGAWANSSETNVAVTEISGGLTNKLYRCSNSAARPPDVLYRRLNDLYARNADLLLANTTIALLLGEREIGPKTYAVFPGGRLEEFINGRPLATEELSERRLSETIAVHLARLHCMKDLPVAKEPQWFSDSVTSWLDETQDVEQHLAEKPDDIKLLREIESLLNIRKEKSWIESKILAETTSPVVFSHNDLQEGNVLLLHTASDRPEIKLIDFEFSSYNFRAFDIANHFREWSLDYSHHVPPYFTLDETKLPTEEQQAIFLREYLKEISKQEDRVINTEKEIEKILKEVKRFVLVSDFAYAVWGIAHAKNSAIPFGYMEYALVRFKAYLQGKQSYLKSIESMSS
ncbi:choline/ethanolamine kinase-like [Oscarella lobularis]|uniref:choline/ethanolamine kinase-like n=1 Tax=Oscarella lobularis TaxID=121494 RepID=UPI003313A1DA